MARTISQTINLQSSGKSKYITDINGAGIKIHPSDWAQNSSYLQLDGTGMSIISTNTNTELAAVKTDGIRIGPTDSYNTRMYSDMFGVYLHNDRLFTIDVNDNEVELYAGNSTFNTNADSYSAAFIESLVWHLNNKFYVGADHQTIYEAATNEDTGLTLETALNNSTSISTPVLGINGQRIQLTDNSDVYVLCEGIIDEYSFSTPEIEEPETDYNVSELTDLVDYFNNNCYVVNDVIYDSSTGTATDYVIGSHGFYIDYYPVRTINYNPDAITDSDIELLQEKSGTDVYILFKLYQSFDDTTPPSYHFFKMADYSYINYNDNNVFELVHDDLQLAEGYSSDAQAAAIGTYIIYERVEDPETGEETEVIIEHLDNGSVVNFIMGGVRLRFKDSIMNMTGNMHFDLPNYQIRYTVDRRLFDNVKLLGWTDCLKIDT